MRDYVIRYYNLSNPDVKWFRIDASSWESAVEKCIELHPNAIVLKCEER